MAKVENPDTPASELVVISDELVERFDSVKTADEFRELATLGKHLAKRFDFEAKANDLVAADAANLDKITCDHCGQTWSLQEPEPLTRFCTHGGFEGRRIFASCVRVATRDDGRVKVQLDLHRIDEEAVHVVCLLDEHNATQIALHIRKGGAGLMVPAWIPVM